MTTRGFSSRSSTTTVQQFPMRDEAAMTVDPGFSNSKAVKDAPDDVHPDVEVAILLDPGASNSDADKATVDANAAAAAAAGYVQSDGAPVDAKQVDAAQVENKSTARRAKKA